MPTSINAYSVGLNLDATNYIKNANLSRKETGTLTRAIQQARTPADHFQRRVELLEKALRKGAIEQGTYNTLLADAEKRFGRAEKKASLYDKAIDGLSGRMKGIGIGAAASAGALATSAISIQTVTNSLSAMGNLMGEIDERAKQARGIGVSYNQLRAFNLAAAEFAGINGPQAGELLSKLNKRAGEASLGFGSAADTFGRLNIGVVDLQKLNAVSLFSRVAEAIKSIKSPAERAAVATQLFEDAGVKLLPLLSQGSAGLEGYSKEIKSLGLTIGADAVSSVESLNDALGRLNLAIEGFQTTMLKNPQTIRDTTAMIQDLTTAAKAAADWVPKLYNTFAPGPIARRVFGLDEHYEHQPSPLAGVKKQMQDMQSQTQLGTPETPIKHFFDKLTSRLDSLNGSLAGTGTRLEMSELGRSMAAEFARPMTAMATAVEQQGTEPSPAIKSLEVGTQQAYEFLTREQTAANQLAKQEAKEQKEQHQETTRLLEQTAHFMERLANWSDENGFTQIR